MREKRVWYWLCARVGWGLESEGRGELVFLREMFNSGLLHFTSSAHSQEGHNEGGFFARVALADAISP